MWVTDLWETPLHKNTAQDILKITFSVILFLDSFFIKLTFCLYAGKILGYVKKLYFACIKMFRVIYILFYWLLSNLCDESILQGFWVKIICYNKKLLWTEKGEGTSLWEVHSPPYKMTAWENAGGNGPTGPNSLKKCGLKIFFSALIHIFRVRECQELSVSSIWQNFHLCSWKIFVEKSPRFFKSGDFTHPPQRG